MCGQVTSTSTSSSLGPDGSGLSQRLFGVSLKGSDEMKSEDQACLDTPKMFKITTIVAAAALVVAPVAFTQTASPCLSSCRAIAANQGTSCNPLMISYLDAGMLECICRSSNFAAPLSRCLNATCPSQLDAALRNHTTSCAAIVGSLGSSSSHAASIASGVTLAIFGAVFSLF